MAYATGSTGLAITVRGSSRRIMIMRFRPANIRLINRRSKLLRLLLALSSGKENANHQNNPIDLAQLTRSLHIRPMHSLRFPDNFSQQKRVFYEQVTGVKGLFFVFSFIGFCFCCCSWFRCSPPGFYSHSG